MATGNDGEGLSMLRESPLHHRAEAFARGSCAAVSLREEPFLTQINLRGDPADAAFRQAVRDATALDLPTTSNRFVEGPGGAAAGVSALWLGPDEWLVVGPDLSRCGLLDSLSHALEGQHVSVVDVSANRTCLVLTGPRARSVLMKGCSLDLHPRAFGTGQCAQSTLARAQIILRQVDDAPTYHLLVRCSFSGYLTDWLLDAMQEYRFDKDHAA